METAGLNSIQMWLAVKMMGSSPALPGGRSAAGALAGRSPGCGYWDQLLCAAAAAGSPPGGGYHGDQLPCVRLYDHAPMAKREKFSMTQTVCSKVCIQYVFVHAHKRPDTCIFQIQF